MSDRVLGIAVFAIATLVVLPGGDGLNLLRQGDEVMHIATVRESIDADTVLVPQLTGQPNSYKPPLLFWMGMAGEWLLGRSLQADRFFVALCAGGTALFLFLLVRLNHLSVARSIAAAFLFMFSLAAFKFGRLLMMDLPMAFFLTAVGWAFVQHQRQRGKKDTGYRYLVLAGLFTGIAFLYKGPLFHVYAALLFLAQAGMRLWSSALLSRRGRMKKAVLRYVKEGSIFAATSLVVPLLWVASLVLQGHGATLWFFFVVENIGKFAAVNQSGWMIVEGWLLYLLPFTLPVLWIAARSMLRPIRNSSEYMARVFLLTAILITLVHLLPDRKDPYYVIPILPLVLAAAVLSFRSSTDTRWVAWLQWAQSLLLILPLTAALFVFAPLWQAALFAALSVIVLGWTVVFGLDFWLDLGRDRRPNATSSLVRITALALIAPVLLMLAFQFFLLPSVTRPLLPERDVSAISKSGLCVVSRNWWDVFELRLYLPGTVIEHAAVGSRPHCADGHRAVVFLQERAEAPEGYALADRWGHWSLHSVSPLAFPRVADLLWSGQSGEAAYQESPQEPYLESVRRNVWKAFEGRSELYVPERRESRR